MTRKEALSQTIDILSKNKKNQALCTALSDILEELPLSHWTRKSVLDSIRQFLNDNGRLPETRELKNPLPNLMTIRRKFGTDLNSFYFTYFPEHCRELSDSHSKERILCEFKREYERLGHPNCKMYQSDRRAPAPSYYMLRKHTGITEWKELLRECGYDETDIRREHLREKHRSQNSFITSISGDFTDIEKLDSAGEKLRDILAQTEDRT